MMKNIKWGVLGCGGIAKKFCSSLKVVEGSELYACASRTEGKSKAFAEKYGATLSFNNYEDFLKTDEIDVVYIATTHNFHYENILQVLRAGKSVLCEKPIAINSSQVKEIFQTAEELNLFVMEAMWTRFLPTLQKAKEWIRVGEIGQVKVIRADFCFNLPFDAENRLYNPELAGGGLLDGGIYPLSLASFTMDGKQPEELQAYASFAKSGVDDQVVTIFKYDTGALAILSCGISAASESRLEISGTEGRIEIPYNFLGADRVILEKLNGEQETFSMTVDPLTSFEYEIRAVQDAIRNKKLQVEEMSWKESIGIMETMDRIRESFT